MTTLTPVKSQWTIFHGQVTESVAVPTIKKRALEKNQNRIGEEVTGYFFHQKVTAILHLIFF